MKSWNYLGVIVLLICSAGTSSAQSIPAVSKGEGEAGANLTRATREYKTNSEDLLKLQKEELERATQKLEQLRPLVADGLVAKNELAAAEDSVAALQATVEVTRKRIGDAEQMIAEIQSEEIRKTQAQAGLGNKTASLMRPTVLRYNGAANWSIAHLAGIQRFYSSTFGRLLPTSTVGQSVTHNRLGWDHRNSVDVQLHPDSVEGTTLISFLQTQGIPFLAFRGAIPGVSTGAHIHIGRPSNRIS